MLLNNVSKFCTSSNKDEVSKRKHTHSETKDGDEDTGKEKHINAFLIENLEFFVNAIQSKNNINTLQKEKETMAVKLKQEGEEIKQMIEKTQRKYDTLETLCSEIKPRVKRLKQEQALLELKKNDAKLRMTELEHTKKLINRLLSDDTEETANQH
jgi:hypothetical protein